MSDAEQVLGGGNMGGAVRAGDTVRRPAGPWSPTVQRLLAHLRRRGLDWVPRPLGVDEQGRDRVSFTAARAADGQAQLHGHVALYQRDAAWVAAWADALAG